MPGLTDFVKRKYSPRTAVSKAADYTLLATDEMVVLTGSTAHTFTMPDLSSLLTGSSQTKVYLLQNNSTADLTVVPFATTQSFNFNGATRSVIVLHPGESAPFSGRQVNGNLLWSEENPTPSPAFLKNNFMAHVTTSGTSAVNVFDAAGCPVACNILSVITNAQDISAGNITITNGTNTVVTIAKSATAGALVGGVGLANTQVAQGAVLTATSSGGVAECLILLEAMSLSNELG